MNIRIYQINPERDENRLMFMDTDYLVHKVGGVTQDSATYDLIYEGKVDCKSLEDVYRVFNLEHPVEFMGHSLSVSDVVEVVDGGREKPGFKYNILKHPNVRLTTDGGTKPYRHGVDTRSIASFRLNPDKVKAAPVTDTKTHNYILLTEEEVEERIMKLEEKNHEKPEQKEHEQEEHRAAPRPW